MGTNNSFALAAATLGLVGAALVVLGFWPTGRGTGEQMIYLPAAGFVHLVAAAGILRRKDWGRVLGIIVSVVGLVAVLGLGLFIVLLARAVDGEIVPTTMLAGVVPLVIYGTVIYLLRRRERAG